MRIGDYVENVVDDKKLVELNSARLRELMHREKVDALFVISPDNWRYVTALPVHHSLYFSTVNAALVHKDARYPKLFALDFYRTGMQQRAPWFEEIVELPMRATREALQPMAVDKWPQIIASTMSKLGLAKAKIAMDPATPCVLKESLQEKLPGAHFVDGGMTLREARRVKNEEELKALRSACVLAEIAMEDAFEVIHEGVSELEIAAEIEYSFRVHGAEYPVFQPLVFSGVHRLLGYANPSSKTVRHGELVRLDIGCCSGGYNSCFARTVLVGRADDTVKEAFAAVRGSLEAAIAAARPGVTNVELHRILAGTLRERSGGKYNLDWYGGHGIGTGIHEDPMVGSKGSVDEVTLEPTMCLALEPSVVVAGRGWLGLEDNIVITSSGCEVLTRTRYGLNP